MEVIHLSAIKVIHTIETASSAKMKPYTLYKITSSANIEYKTTWVIEGFNINL